MPRRAAKIDANHNEIVRALRDVGAGVQSLASLGHGCPDLLGCDCYYCRFGWMVPVIDDEDLEHQEATND